MKREDLTKFAADLGRMTKQYVADAIGPLERRIAELEQRPSLKYQGVWRSDVQYAGGDTVSHGGGMWVAMGATKARPGDGRSWQLAVKAGRDGKDAR